ncbi:hypothetical protein A1OS_21095 [Enterovibrio norvegicus]|nr:hypothetical protein A1OS_21095 [Enterovibrio norvegicus]
MLNQLASEFGLSPLTLIWSIFAPFYAIFHFRVVMPPLSLWIEKKSINTFYPGLVYYPLLILASCLALLPAVILNRYYTENIDSTNTIFLIFFIFFTPLFLLMEKIVNMYTKKSLQNKNKR